METNLQLTPDEEKVLESVYGLKALSGRGYNPNQIDEVLELTPQEEKFFKDKNFLSPHFFVQTLYKARGVANPIKFNISINRMFRANKNLLANFCNVGSRTVKVIKPLVAVKPEVVFCNFTTFEPEDLNDEFRKAMEADMRRDFDLRHDVLIRFAVYKTGMEEFAVLVTMAQIIAEHFDSDKLFNELLNLPAEPKREEPPEDFNAAAQEMIRKYWAGVLNNPPPPAQLPFTKKLSGVYNQKAYRMKVDADILSDLRGFAQSNRTMLTAILQSAWGFMLQAVNKRRDCLFCQVLPSKRRVKNFSLNVIPVRLSCENNSTVEEIVKQQFRHLGVSQAYSFDWEDLESFTGKKKLFEHFLSFAEFQASELNYVETPAEMRGKIISRNSWDAQGMKLGVYFRHSEKNLSLTFLYDASSFFNGGGALIANLYKLTLQQVLVDRNAKYADFIKNLAKRLESVDDSKQLSREEELKKIRDFLAQLSLLRDEAAAVLFANKAELVTRFEGDRISGDMLKEKFVFVVSGKLVRSVDDGDGWYNPLDVIDKNSFVNPTNFLDKQRLTLSAEVLTEQAELLTIPRSDMIEIIRKTPEIALSLMNYALNQMEKYQALWLQS